mmetsp:Transcript_15158/g.46878  ORF Transcript_15158/g.46878 Transcript_15158/m.46878 type:complete len:320 (+) Transcript_15158:3118-4077(+)
MYQGHRAGPRRPAASRREPPGARLSSDAAGHARRAVRVLARRRGRRGRRAGGLRPAVRALRGSVLINGAPRARGDGRRGRRRALGRREGVGPLRLRPLRVGLDDQEVGGAGRGFTEEGRGHPRRRREEAHRETRRRPRGDGRPRGARGARAARGGGAPGRGRGAGGAERREEAVGREEARSAAHREARVVARQAAARPGAAGTVHDVGVRVVRQEPRRGRRDARARQQGRGRRARARRRRGVPPRPRGQLEGRTRGHEAEPLHVRDGRVCGDGLCGAGRGRRRGDGVERALASVATRRRARRRGRRLRRWRRGGLYPPL